MALVASQAAAISGQTKNMLSRGKPASYRKP